MAVKWSPDAEEEVPQPKKSRETFALEDLQDGRCTASTWRVKRPKKPDYENYFGPGGYNRCIGPEGHKNQLHKDEWGYVFVAEPFRVVRLEERSS